MPSIKFRTTASEASNSTNSHDAPPSRRRLGGLADLYLRKRLTRDSHPALKAVRDDGEATSDMLLVPTAPGTTSDLSLVQQQSQNGINEQIESDDEGDVLYAAPLFPHILIAFSELTLHAGKICT